MPRWPVALMPRGPRSATTASSSGESGPFPAGDFASSATSWSRRRAEAVPTRARRFPPGPPTSPRSRCFPSPTCRVTPVRNTSATASPRRSPRRCRACAGSSSSRATRPSSTRARRVTSAMWGVSSASATSSGAACAGAARAFGSPASCSTPLPAMPFGRNVTTAI